MIFFLGHQGRQLMMANAAHIMLLHTRNPCDPFLIFIGMILWTNIIIWSSVTRGEEVKWFFWVNNSTVFDCKYSPHHSALCMKDCDLPFTCEHKKVTRNQLWHLMLDRGEKEERLGKVQGGKESYYYVNSTWKMYWREEIQTGLKSLFLIFWPVSIKIPNWSESNFFYVHLYTDILP